jgi:hypothetical protein
MHRDARVHIIFCSGQESRDLTVDDIEFNQNTLTDAG